tara:strand:- start:662 stop:772 length:111 start_codon:yes stop_codon:yes gene_type:complete
MMLQPATLAVAVVLVEEYTRQGIQLGMAVVVGKLIS